MDSVSKAMRRHGLTAGLWVTLAVLAVFLLPACGSKEEQPLEPSEVVASSEPPWVESIPESSEEPEPEVEPSEPVDPDPAPAPGMVRSALTNEWEDESIAASRPIAVMYPTDAKSQPQYGVGQAGVFYECMEEGKISRQMGIIEDWQQMELIGNIRSSRAYYVYPCMEWDALLVHWGGPYYLVDMVRRPEVNNLSGAGIGGGAIVAPATGGEAFYRYPKGSKATIHNGFTDGPALVAAATKAGYELAHRDEYYDGQHFQFAAPLERTDLSSAAGAVPASRISLSSIFPITKSALTYDESSGMYRKLLRDEPQIDAITGDQVEFANVIVQTTRWKQLDSHDYLEFTMVDEGRSGWFYTGGYGIPITWTKESDYAPTRYYDLDGNEIVLNTGHTYIAIAQDGYEPVCE